MFRFDPQPTSVAFQIDDPVVYRHVFANITVWHGRHYRQGQVLPMKPICANLGRNKPAFWGTWAKHLRM